MKRKIIGFFIMVLLVAIAGNTIVTNRGMADWSQGDGHKMHYPQLPGIIEPDIFNTLNNCHGYNQYIADDWECSETGIVTEIHFWGAWRGDGPVDAEITAFDIKIGKHPLSLAPSNILWEHTFTSSEFIRDGPFNCDSPWFNPGNPSSSYIETKYYQYNIENIGSVTTPFHQIQGERYWLIIGSYSFDVEDFWGWRTTDSDHFGNYAKYHSTSWSDPSQWLTINFQNDKDMAFVINGTAGVPPIAKFDDVRDCNICDFINLDASDSYDPDGTITGYRWDFQNDGIWDTGWLSQPTLTHTFCNPGPHTIRLEVKDNDGLTNDYIYTMDVNPASSDFWSMFHHDLCHTGYSTCDGPGTLSIYWSYNTGDRVWSSPAIWCDKVYVGSSDKNIYCFDSDPYDDGVDEGFNDPTGANYDIIWQFQANDQVLSSPAISCGMVYFASYGNNDNGIIYCLDAITGIVIWSYQTNSQITSSPAVEDGDGDGIKEVYIGTYDEMICLNAANGNIDWINSEVNIEQSSPMLFDSDDDGDMEVYIGGHDGFSPWNWYVYCIDSTNGNIIWQNPTINTIHSSPTLSNCKVDPQHYRDCVIIGSHDRRLYFLDAQTGQEYLIYGPLTHRIQTTPVAVDINNDGSEEIYFGVSGTTTNEGAGYCINTDLTIPQTFWINSSIGAIESSPAVVKTPQGVAQDGYVYFGSHNGNIYCLDATPNLNGGSQISPLSVFYTGDLVFSSPVVYENRLYVGSSNNMFYCLFPGIFSNLDVNGELTWAGQTPGSSVTGNLQIANIGQKNSDLNWEIVEHPEWGTWAFSQESGANLKPEDGPVQVEVEVEAPDEETKEFKGEVKIINLDNPEDYVIVPVSLSTPKNKATHTMPLFLRVLENYPMIYQLLQRFLQL